MKKISSHIKSDQITAKVHRKYLHWKEVIIAGVRVDVSDDLSDRIADRPNGATPTKPTTDTQGVPVR